VPSGGGRCVSSADEWARGMGSSVRLGVHAVQPVSAVVVLACDQPAVDDHGHDFRHGKKALLNFAQRIFKSDTK
jgi:CTP:molybdopterin cytidylyltransferase MocA